MWYRNQLKMNNMQLIIYALHNTHTHTHNTTILRLCGICPGQPGWAGTRRNIHPQYTLRLNSSILWAMNGVTKRRYQRRTTWDGQKLQSVHIMRKGNPCLMKDITEGTMPGSRIKGRSRTAWIDNVKRFDSKDIEASACIGHPHLYVQYNGMT